MIEQIVSSSVWSVAGFVLGWFACIRWQRLEKKIDHIDETLTQQEDKSHDDA